MNIDLLRAKGGVFGLVSDQPFAEAPRAVLFDPAQGTLSVEFGSESDALVCNVPVVEDWRFDLTLEDAILVGCVADGMVQAAERVPLRSLT